jgi:hypothetical protein
MGDVSDIPHVLDLTLNVLGWGGDVILLTSKPDTVGDMVPPVVWYDRTTTVFQKVTTLFPPFSKTSSRRS